MSIERGVCVWDGPKEVGRPSGTSGSGADTLSRSGIGVRTCWIGWVGPKFVGNVITDLPGGCNGTKSNGDLACVNALGGCSPGPGLKTIGNI